MRLKADFTLERVEFLRQLFTNEPELSVRKAQAKLQEKFATRVIKGDTGYDVKGTMRNAKILSIRAEVLTAAKKAGTKPV